MKKYFEPFLIISFTTFIIFLSFYPTIEKFLNAPKNTTYIGTHNYVLDYSTYLYTITQGQRGQLLTRELYTAEEQPGSLSHIYFTLAGLLTSPFKIPPYIVYHLLRLVSAFFFAAVIYWFVSLFVNKNNKFLSPSFQRISLFFLSYVSAGFPRLPQFDLNFPEWSGFDVVRRSGFLPHGLMQNSLMLLTIGLFIKYEQSPKRKYLILAGILLFVTNLFSPFHSGLALLSYSIYSLSKLKIKNVLLLFAFFLPTFIYIQYAYTLGVLAWVKEWEASAIHLINFKEYVQGLGPIFFLGIIGIPIAARKKGYKNFFLIFITITTLAFLFILKLDTLLKISNFRFLGMPLHVFLGILSFYTLSVLFSRYKKIVIAILIILFIQSLPIYYLSFNQLKNEYIGSYPYNVFLPDDYYQGIIWIKENTNFQKDIILARPLTGNLIPAFSGNRVYLGHPVATLNYRQKLEKLNEFYDNKMTANEAQKFLSENNISYIFFEFDNKPLAEKLKFLKPVFNNAKVVIYKFIPFSP